MPKPNIANLDLARRLREAARVSPDTAFSIKPEADGRYTVTAEALGGPFFGDYPSLLRQVTSAVELLLQRGGSDREAPSGRSRRLVDRKTGDGYMARIRTSAQLPTDSRDWALARCREGACPLGTQAGEAHRRHIVQQCAKHVLKGEDRTLSAAAETCPRRLEAGLPTK